MFLNCGRKPESVGTGRTWNSNNSTRKCTIIRPSCCKAHPDILWHNITAICSKRGKKKLFLLKKQRTYKRAVSWCGISACVHKKEGDSNWLVMKYTYNITGTIALLPINSCFNQSSLSCCIVTIYMAEETRCKILYHTVSQPIKTRTEKVFPTRMGIKAHWHWGYILPQLFHLGRW